MGRKGGKWGLKRLENAFLLGWIGRQSIKVKACVGVVFVVCLLVALKFIVRDHSHFFVASETVHMIGTMILIYKLTTHKTCSGLSLKSQELTAIYLAVRFYCSIILEEDIHVVLDFATLISTLWVIYMMRFKLKSTYIKELDNMPIYYVVIPVVILSFLVRPYMRRRFVTSWFWAFTVYLESVAVLPQLRIMQNAKMVETFTGHYVFALGVARFFGCAHWIIRVIETRGHYLYFLGSGYLWPSMVLLAETVQTFILADFCYYYVKSVMHGQLLVRLPSPV